MPRCFSNLPGGPWNQALQDLTLRVDRDLTAEAIYLFGSHARGTATDCSDVDVAVVSEGLSDLPRPERTYRLLSCWDGVCGIDAIGWTPEEFLTLSSPVMWDVLEFGVPLRAEGPIAQAARCRFEELRASGQLTLDDSGWWTFPPPAARPGA